ncbi:uncharacterized protein LOC144318101 [Canis aureus]
MVAALLPGSSGLQSCLSQDQIAGPGSLVPQPPGLRSFARQLPESHSRAVVKSGLLGSRLGDKMPDGVLRSKDYARHLGLNQENLAARVCSQLDSPQCSISWAFAGSTGPAGVPVVAEQSSAPPSIFSQPAAGLATR